jgi:hypothetical protein
LVDGDPKKALALIFGEGRFQLDVTSGNAVSGLFDMGNGYVLDVLGEVRPSANGSPYQLFMSGAGRSGTPTEGWLYEYLAYPGPTWPQGQDQVPSILGTVLRTLPHNGEPAGVTASFVLVSGQVGALAPSQMSGVDQVAVPSYAQAIRPKFRPGDVNCMARRGVNLADPAWMCDAAGNDAFPDHANARRVFDALSAGEMPPDAPWPQDWLSQYQGWMAGGFQA